MNRKKILIGVVVVVAIVMVFAGLLHITRDNESSGTLAFYVGTQYDVNGDQKVSSLDVKYCLLNGDIRCDFNGNGVLFDSSDRKELADAVKGPLALSYGGDCSQADLDLIDANDDCKINDWECLEMIDLQAEGTISTACWSDALNNIWAQEDVIPGCVVAATADCTDTDDGIKPYVKGAISGEYEERTDACTGSVSVIEYVCTDSKGHVAPDTGVPGGGNVFKVGPDAYGTATIYACPYGCSDGACLTEEPTPTVPGPTVPVIGGLFEGLNSLLMGWSSYVSNLLASLPHFSTLSVSNVAAGDPVNPSISLTSPVIGDTDYSDGEVRYLIGNWALYRDTTLVNEGEWNVLTSNTFTAEETFESLSDGHYAFIAVIAQADASYDHQVGQWSYETEGWDVSEVIKDGEAFTVGVPTAPVAPTAPGVSIGDIISGILSFLGSLIGL